MKKLIKILIIVLIAAGLMQTYRAYMGQKYRCDVLARQVDQYDTLSQAFVESAHVRADRDAQQIADLETRLQILTNDKLESTDDTPKTFAQRP